MGKRYAMAKFFSLAVTILLIIPMTGTLVSADTFKLTFGVGAPADPIPFIKTVRDFWAPEIQQRVESKTGHKIEWTLHFSPAVVKVTDGFEAIKDGLLDSGIAFPIFENPALFIHNFSYFAPFGTSDQKMATKVNLKVYDMNPWLKEVFEKKHNQKWLATFTYESYDLVTAFPVKTLDDLKGKKIAAAGPNLPWIKSVGCTPVQSNIMDAYTSLQTGVYEGWVLPTSAISGFKLYEVAKYMNMVGFGCISGGSLTMNLDVWNSLPKDVQDIIMEVGREYSERTAVNTQEKHDASIEALKKLGVTFFEFPIDQKRDWMKTLGSMAQEKAAEADKLGQPGAKVIQDYITEMANAGYEWPIKWTVQ
jgi:TRAP-type C4-dicarboxylate transport system substrate-binding protein